MINDTIINAYTKMVAQGASSEDVKKELCIMYGLQLVQLNRILSFVV
jgi:hypothetical protein